MNCRKCGQVLIGGMSIYCSFCEPFIEPKHGHPFSTNAIAATDLHLKTVEEVPEAEYTTIPNTNQVTNGASIYQIISGRFIRM